MDDRGRGAADGLVARVRAARGGDGAAWSDLVDEFAPLLRWVAHRHGLAGDEVDDVVQDTWLLCVEHLGRLRDEQCLPAWLLTTCRRVCLRRLRALQRCVPQDSTDVLTSVAAVSDPDGDAFDVLARHDSRVQLYTAIHDLPVRERRILLALLDEVGDGYADTSRRLGVPVGSLGPTRRRAVARLQGDPRLYRAG